MPSIDLHSAEHPCHLIGIRAWDHNEDIIIYFYSKLKNWHAKTWKNTTLPGVNSQFNAIHVSKLRYNFTHSTWSQTIDKKPIFLNPIHLCLFYEFDKGMYSISENKNISMICCFGRVSNENIFQRLDMISINFEVLSHGPSSKYINLNTYGLFLLFRNAV